MYATTYDGLFVSAAHARGLEPWLLKAIACVESNLNPRAYRHGAGERRFYKRYIHNRKQGHPYYNRPEVIAASYGLLQVMYTTAEQVGFPPGGDPELLYDPARNVELGAEYLRLQYRRYGNVSTAVSAYNAGVARVVEGRYQNQAYVDRVMRLGTRILEEQGPDLGLAAREAAS